MKGKLRSLLARDKGSLPAKGLDGFKNDCDEIKRLFGSTVGEGDAKGAGIQMSRLQFSDCFLTDKELGQIFETKFENTIDRLTSVANPRTTRSIWRGLATDVSRSMVFSNFVSNI